MTSQPSIFNLKAEESSGLLLWQVSMLWQRGIKKVLQPFDLTHPQFVLLASAQWFAQQGNHAGIFGKFHQDRPNDHLASGAHFAEQRPHHKGRTQDRHPRQSSCYHRSRCRTHCASCR